MSTATESPTRATSETSFWEPAENLPKTLPAMVRQAAASHPERAAIVNGDLTISYAQLLEHSEAVARSLIALGVAPGDRVAVWAPNLPEWILAACGIHASGAILVPLNTRMKGAEVADVLERSGTTLMFCIGNFLGQYYPQLLGSQRPACLKHIVVLGEGHQTATAMAGEMPWKAFLEAGASVDVAQVLAREQQLSADSTADLMFTSGTTGRPKGVMSAHGPSIRAFSNWSRVVGLKEHDRYLIVNPFFHSFGYKAGWVAAFLQGATVYPEQVFDADAVLGRIERDRINFLPGPPTLFLTMLGEIA